MTPFDHPPRRRRVPAGLGAAALAAAVLLTTTAPATAAPSPTAAPAPAPESEVFVLTGPDGQPTAPASSERAARRSAAPGAAGPGWSAALDLADGSQGIGVAWDGAAPGTVSVRGRTATGWTAWQELEGEPGEGPDSTERTGTELLWLGPDGVDEVQLRVDAGLLEGLALQAVRATITNTPLAAPAAASDGRPAIQPRSAWTNGGWVASSGCTPAPVAYSGGIGFAVVHHTVNSNTYAAGEVPAMLAAIYAYDTGTLGWCDIAYHFVIDRFGRIWEGRSGGVTNPIIGTHAKGFNRGSVGVALLGQHHPSASPAAASPTTAALTAVGQIIGWKLALHGLSPNGTATVTSSGSSRYPAGAVVTINRVSGHRDTQLTSCPGDLVYAQLAKIRATAASYQASLPAPPADVAPFRTSGALVIQQYRDLLRRIPSQERYDHWSGQVPTNVTPGSLIANLVGSTDADALLHATTRLYRAYFLRLPDHAGFTYWTGRRAGGTTLARVSNTFAASSEFTNRYGNLSDADFVRRVYQNVLGRAPDASGQSYWTRRLADGESRGVVMLSFSQSSEFVRKTQPGNQVVALYETLIGRAVTQQAFDTLTADLGAGRRTVADVATSLFVSASYRKRFATPS